MAVLKLCPNGVGGENTSFTIINSANLKCWPPLLIIGYTAPYFSRFSWLIAPSYAIGVILQRRGNLANKKVVSKSMLFLYEE